ncbi:MAG: formate dehydrogenase accessory sulfurtransferase FdhD [Ardenticatenales bacterium]
MSSATEQPQPSRAVPILALNGEAAARRADRVAVEEPLEIRIAAAEDPLSFQRVAITMRTPGADAELATGFLFAEGVIAAAADVVYVTHCLEPEITAEQRGNVVTVTLRAGLAVDLAPLERHFTVSSACGVCGKAGIDQLAARGVAAVSDGARAMMVAPALLYALPDRLRAAQDTFDATGGLHAAGLFDADGTLCAVREDVGRHNALDKLVGWALAGGRTPLGGHIVLVSGRASYELVQKCAVAGVSVLAAVGAPSSLAIETAAAFGMTLVGFVRGERANVYAGAERVSGPLG